MLDFLTRAYDALRAHPFINGVLPHLLTVAGFLLAFFAIARLMSERRQPGNTFAWLLAIAFIPYVGVPLYLMLGGRKIRQLAARKTRLCPIVPGVPTRPPRAVPPRKSSRSTARVRPSAATASISSRVARNPSPNSSTGSSPPKSPFIS